MNILHFSSEKCLMALAAFVVDICVDCKFELPKSLARYDTKTSLHVQSQ
jgi:hypothetical protein